MVNVSIVREDHFTDNDTTLAVYAWGWRVVETCVKRSASRQGLWLVSVTVDGSRLWHGEEWSREAAIRRVVDILTHLDEQQPDAFRVPEPEPVSNL